MDARYAIILVGLVALAYGCITAGGVQQPAANNTTQNPQPGTGNQGPGAGNWSPNDNTTAPGPATLDGITREMCEGTSGHWNECGSACRGAPPGTACIMMCVVYCECGGIAGFGCPQGYECTDYLPTGKDGSPVPDAMGICKKKR